MQRKSGLGIGIALSVLAFFIGLGGVFQLIGIAEGANNAVTAFAAVSIAFALLAGFLAWLAPSARWAIGITMSAPVVILAILGSWSGSVLLLGAVWTTALTCAGAYLGSRLPLGKSVPPPPAPPSNETNQGGTDET